MFMRSSTRTRSAITFRRTAATAPVENASSPMYVWVRRFEALRRLQMPHFKNPLNLTSPFTDEVQAVPSPMPVSPVTPIVKPKGYQRRVLLLTSETTLEAEVRDALRIRQQDGESALFFELTHLDPTLLFDFLAVLDLLDHVRHGYFDMIHIVPSASTWSRSRHSEHSGQPPLRSRSYPLGLSSLSPVETENINEANRACEVAVWVAEQALQCPSKMIGLNLIFPEDLGGHCLHGPSSIWVLREFRFLEGTRDARRAAAYMCQFTRANYKRPIGILSNCTRLRPLLFFGLAQLG